MSLRRLLFPPHHHDTAAAAAAAADNTESSGNRKHTLQTVAQLWHAANWLAQHQRFCTVGCVLAEYVTKVALTQLPADQQDECFRMLSQTTGVDVRSVDVSTLVSTAVTGRTSSAALFRDVFRDVHARSPPGGSASHVLRTLGEAAVTSYLNHQISAAPTNAPPPLPHTTPLRIIIPPAMPSTPTSSA